MASLKFTFLVIISNFCFQRTSAIGLCDFAERFPCKDNVRSVCFKSSGCKGLNSSKGQTTLGNTRQAQLTTEHITSDITAIPVCPPNMVYANCSTCQSTCRDPKGCFSNCTEPETCVCADGFLLKGDDCVSEEECECFIEGEGVIHDGETYLNSNCSQQCHCAGTALECEVFKCSGNATCGDKHGEYRCDCNESFYGDGQICTAATDCQDVFNLGYNSSGLYTITPRNWPYEPFDVFCNISHDGGWTVFQRRINGSVDFYRNWNSYKEGFGPLKHEFWIGNDKLYFLTNQRSYTLRIDFVAADSVSYYAEYDLFRINDKIDNYRLIEIGTYTGDAGRDSLIEHKSEAFSTYDRDNDSDQQRNCAEVSNGAWWYKTCHPSSLNGGYFNKGYNGIFWKGLTGGEGSIKYTEMKLRPN